jgi:hypothetical protein
MLGNQLQHQEPSKYFMCKVQNIENCLAKATTKLHGLQKQAKRIKILYPQQLTWDFVLTKPRMWRFLFLLSMLATLTSLPISNALGATDRLDKIAVICQLTGKAWTVDKLGTKHTLQLKSQVFARDVLKTGKNSSLELRFLDDTIFNIGQDGHVILDKYIYDPKATVGQFESTIQQGIFRYKSGKLAQFKKHEQHTILRTPQSTIGIRGSELQGDVAKDGSAVFVHRSGLMNIMDSSGKFLSSLSKPGNAVRFSRTGKVKFFQAPKSLLKRLNKGIRAKRKDNSPPASRKKRSDDKAPPIGKDGSSPPNNDPEGDPQSLQTAETAISELTDNVEIDGENALECYVPHKSGPFVSTWIG